MAAAGTPKCLEELGDNASLLTPEVRSKRSSSKCRATVLAKSSCQPSREVPSPGARPRARSGTSPRVPDRPDHLNAHFFLSPFGSQDLNLACRLIANGQEHLFSSWPAAGVKDGEKRQLMSQLRGLDAAYSGGLLHYISNARRLLQDSEQGARGTRRVSAAGAGSLRRSPS